MDPFVKFDALVASLVLAYLSAEDASPMTAVSRLWKQVSSDDAIWGQWCRSDFRLTARQAVDPGGQLQDVAHYMPAWHSWRAFGRRLGLRRVDAPLYQRVLSMWRQIEDWAAVHRPSIRASLAPGATRAELEAFETEGDLQLPDVVKMIWGVHNGQCLEYDDVVDSEGEPTANIMSQVFDGLFGGYSYYTNFVCTRMFSLQRMAKYFQRTRSAWPSRVIIATSWNLSKPFFLDVADDMVYVTRMQTPCVPLEPLGILRWMEEYATRLTTGVYTCDHLIPDEDSLGINLFPQTGPLVSVRVSHGIEAKATSIYVPENPRSWFTYSIRLQVARAEEFPHPRAQLESRHWRIQDGNGHVEQVHGEGVIGKFPVLYPGGYRNDEQGEEGDDREGVFVYQSCSGHLHGVPPGRGEFSGTLTFVPGTIEEPLNNEAFEVEVGAFPLVVPEYVF